MERCPTGQRRIEGKCVYKNLYEDSRRFAREFRQTEGADLEEWVRELSDIYAMQWEDNVEERFEQVKHRRPFRWDDFYYCILGAGEGW